MTPDPRKGPGADGGENAHMSSKPAFTLINRREFLRPTSGSAELHNKRVLRFESVAIGIVNAAYQFVPVLMTRLGGSPFQIALLAAMPYVGTLFLAIPIGRRLQSRTRIVPLYSRSRLLTSLPYGATAIALQLGAPLAIPVVLIVWALYSLPGAVTSVTMPMVMDGIAGPRGRFALMGIRWSTQVLVTGVAVFLMGLVLSSVTFPLGYQVVLLTATVAGVVGAWFAHQFWIPPPRPASEQPASRPTWRSLGDAVWRARDFRRFLLCEVVFLGGLRLALPLIPIYYVREIGASDASIGIIATVQASGQLLGYVVWPRVSKRWNERTVLLIVLPLAAIYPGLLSTASDLAVVALLAGLAALFTAGVDLVMFDELMRTAPTDQRPTFVSVHVTIGHSTIILAPLVGAAVASTEGIDAALRVATAVSLVGLACFLVHVRRTRPRMDRSGA